ncbi:MAG TPA: sulfatase, partial [bacterium]|nr:sulfatase [bacterium]
IGMGSLALATGSALFNSCRKKLKKPNIVFIMSDDHGEQAISCYNDELLQTPNIDRIAREGVRFNNSFVTNSICAPSRAVLLTGKYSHLNGLRDNLDTFDNSQTTFPKLLRQNGYQTAMIGKWHLKSEPTGFDFWKILKGQGQYYNPTFHQKQGSKQYTGYTTDIITDQAIDFLQTRDNEKPFCMLVHHKAPHRNFMPPIKYLDKFEDKKFPIPDTFFDDYSTRKKTAGDTDMRIEDMYLSLDMKLNPEDYGKQTGTGGLREVADPQTYYKENLTEEQLQAWNAHYDKISQEFAEADLSGKELTKWKYQRYLRDYAACCLSVDDNVGRLLDYLDDKDLTDDTIVIYTSDQGFYLGEHGWYDKRFMYEESLSMPLVMRYPREIDPKQVNDEIVLNLDFAPTFLDYANAEIPNTMQGRSFRTLLNENNPDWRDAMYYHYYEYPHGWHFVKRHYGIRTHRYKLIHFYNDVDIWELYDLKKDPDELNNVYNDPQYSEIVKELKNRLKELRIKYRDNNFET